MRSNIFEREIKTAGHIRYLTMTDAKLIWMPDTFFRNEKIGKVVTFHRFSLFLHSLTDCHFRQRDKRDKTHKGNFPFPSTTQSLSVSNAAKPFGLKHFLKNLHPDLTATPLFDILISETTTDINTVIKGWRCWWIGIQILQQMLEPKRLSSVFYGKRSLCNEEFCFPRRVPN